MFVKVKGYLEFEAFLEYGGFFLRVENVGILYFLLNSKKLWKLNFFMVIWFYE